MLLVLGCDAVPLLLKGEAFHTYGGEATTPYAAGFVQSLEKVRGDPSTERFKGSRRPGGDGVWAACRGVFVSTCPGEEVYVHHPGSGVLPLPTRGERGLLSARSLPVSSPVLLRGWALFIELSRVLLFIAPCFHLPGCVMPVFEWGPPATNLVCLPPALPAVRGCPGWFESLFLCHHPS